MGGRQKNSCNSNKAGKNAEILKPLGAALTDLVQWGSQRAVGLRPPVRSGAHQRTQLHPVTPIASTNLLCLGLICRAALQSGKTDCTPSEAEIGKHVSFVRIVFCHSYSLPSDSGNRSVTGKERLGDFKTILVSLG